PAFGWIPPGRRLPIRRLLRPFRCVDTAPGSTGKTPRHAFVGPASPECLHAYRGCAACTRYGWSAAPRFARRGQPQYGGRVRVPSVLGFLFLEFLPAGARCRSPADWPAEILVNLSYSYS